MSTFEKIYIGKGKAVANLDKVVAVTIPLEKILAHTFEYEGKEYIKFEVGPMQKADNYGRTHTAWINNKVEEKPKGRRKKAS